MSECDRFPAGSLQRRICEGTARMPLWKINAYRERAGLAPLTEDQVEPYDPPKREAPTRPPRRESSGAGRQPRRREPRATQPPKKRSGGCGACSKRKRQTLNPDGHGPGSKLLELFNSAGVPHCQACINAAAQMDAWGVDGCREHLTEIVEDILPRARDWMAANKPWAHRLLPNAIEDAGLRFGVRVKVEQAIKAAES